LTDKKESWLDTFGIISKMNPVAFVLIFACMSVATFTLQSNTSLEMKALLFFMAFIFSFLTIIFEAYRLDREKELKEKVFISG
jgi:uncharacterized membrane protein YdbT with pleckstrin-like domain